jgi:hypothetical protein
MYHYPCIIQSSLDTFEFDISNLTPSENQWISIQIEATDDE